MSHCVACLEPIKEGARLCPRCGSAQTKSRRRKIGDAVKWAGGAVTVVSLSMGVITLSGLYGQWRQEQRAVTEHVEAAKWLSETEHYPQAWQMLHEALELSPSAPAPRRSQFDLAMVWLRDFSAEKEDAGETLDELTAVLYRRLARADDDQVATILAHVAWAQILRAKFQMPAFVDVDALFERALDSSPTNGYANAFCGYWRLFQRGVDPDDVRLAQTRFRTALDSGLDRELVRDLQLGPLSNLTYGRSDELERAALTALLETSFEMMQGSEPAPRREIRFRILDNYGVMGHGDHIESLVGAMPPDDHLAVNAWLREGLETDGRERMVTQMRYLEARLLEARGDTALALERYRELLEAEESTEPLDDLVNAAIERLTGELPERALARKYIDDPVGGADPWSFHVETLVNFDPRYRPRNLDQAIEFLTVAVATKDRRVPDLLPTLERTERRVREVVSEGDERARIGGFTTGYSRGHYELAQSNLVRVSVLRGQSLVAYDDLDAGVATLRDASKIADGIDDGSSRLRPFASYELAAAHARRAEEDAGDRAEAVKRLRLAVNQGVVDHGIATWDDIKGDTFRGLVQEPGYQELVRGR